MSTFAAREPERGGRRGSSPGGRRSFLTTALMTVMGEVRDGEAVKQSLSRGTTSGEEPRSPKEATLIFRKTRVGNVKFSKRGDSTRERIAGRLGT